MENKCQPLHSFSLLKFLNLFFCLILFLIYVCSFTGINSGTSSVENTWRVLSIIALICSASLLYTYWLHKKCVCDFFKIFLIFLIFVFQILWVIYDFNSYDLHQLCDYLAATNVIGLACAILLLFFSAKSFVLHTYSKSGSCSCGK
ncbi:MAG: hypothetical protein LBB95_02030 [Mycoplasmataceae bacterium]|jgi:hypothetical protein|nr:hypothetical protein [Mycoplasmataceae bacterium]